MPISEEEGQSPNLLRAESDADDSWQKAGEFWHTDGAAKAWQACVHGCGGTRVHSPLQVRRQVSQNLAKPSVDLLPCILGHMEEVDLAAHNCRGIYGRVIRESGLHSSDVSPGLRQRALLGW